MGRIIVFSCLLDTSSDFIDSFQKQLIASNSFYRILGSSARENISEIISRYRTLKTIFPKNVPKYVDAISELAKIKNNSDLEELIAIELSTGLVGEKELLNSYDLLGGNITDDTTAESIIQRYNFLVATDPYMRDSYISALKNISNYRDCPNLDLFINQLDEKDRSMDHCIVDLSLLIFIKVGLLALIILETHVT